MTKNKRTKKDAFSILRKTTNLEKKSEKRLKDTDKKINKLEKKSERMYYSDKAR